jgi:hypothetical protein
MRMMPADVVTAHAEYSDWPTKYTLSNTLAGSACQVARAGGPDAAAGVAGAAAAGGFTRSQVTP